MSGGGSSEELPGVNMTAMIDIVFQLIIFFIFTVKMEEGIMSEGIDLAMAPNGKQIVSKDPREIIVEVGADGKIRINRSILSPSLFSNIMAKAASEYKSDLPVVIVADSKVQHKYVRKVMDTCSAVGIWKLKFMALKEGK
jgi:biopolymer transport protein ExbD